MSAFKLMWPLGDVVEMQLFISNSDRFRDNINMRWSSEGVKADTVTLRHMMMTMMRRKTKL